MTRNTIIALTALVFAVAFWLLAYRSDPNASDYVAPGIVVLLDVLCSAMLAETLGSLWQEREPGKVYSPRKLLIAAASWEPSTKRANIVLGWSAIVYAIACMATCVLIWAVTTTEMINRHFQPAWHRWTYVGLLLSALVALIVAIRAEQTASELGYTSVLSLGREVAGDVCAFCRRPDCSPDPELVLRGEVACSFVSETELTGNMEFAS